MSGLLRSVCQVLIYAKRKLKQLHSTYDLESLHSLGLNSDATEIRRSSVTVFNRVTITSVVAFYIIINISKIKGFFFFFNLDSSDERLVF